MVQGRGVGVDKGIEKGIERRSDWRICTVQ